LSYSHRDLLIIATGSWRCQSRDAKEEAEVGAESSGSDRVTVRDLREQNHHRQGKQDEGGVASPADARQFFRRNGRRHQVDEQQTD